LTIAVARFFYRSDALPITRPADDDVNLGGTVKTVASDVAEIIRAGSEMGLSLNVSKCELIAYKDFQVNDAPLQSFHRVEFEERLCFLVQHLTRRGMIGVRTSPEPLTD